ncbi:Uncharacterised protein [Vibrio cholerae]|nr:Uncharacterised protein [Vibrio cholerae]
MAATNEVTVVTLPTNPKDTNTPAAFPTKIYAPKLLAIVDTYNAIAPRLPNPARPPTKAALELNALNSAPNPDIWVSTPVVEIVGAASCHLSNKESNSVDTALPLVFNVLSNFVVKS